MTLPGLPGLPGDLGALGPFFAVDRHDPGDPPAGAWRPMRELAGDPGVLDGRVAAVRAFLADGGRLDVEDVELRVAASVVHLGLAARLASPLLAMAVLDGLVPALTLADLRWQPRLGGPFPLSLPRPLPECDARTTDQATALAPVLIDGISVQLAAAMERFGVNEHILRGNTASAIAGAARMLADARPDHAARVHTLLDGLLRHPYLHGSARYTPGGTFRRRSCCLIYRAARGREGALCGDCVLGRATVTDGTPV